MTRAHALATLFATALLISGVALWSSCFAPTYSDCAFRCANTEPSCPTEYECQSDGYCHLPGSTAVCAIPKPVDLSGVVLPDLSLPDDAMTNADGS